jgi:hypothetical protein
MKLKARLINKKKPTLLIKKISSLKTGSLYKIRFVGNKRDEELTSYLKNFDQEHFCFEFVHKLTGAFNLKYQENYDVDVAEVK